MPSKKITDHQVHKCKQDRNTLTQVASAARAGMSERSARRIDDTDVLPSQRTPRSWRTREDPLSAVWDAEVIPLLQTDAQLNAVTLFEELQRRHPGLYDTGVRSRARTSNQHLSAYSTRSRTPFRSDGGRHSKLIADKK